MHNSGRGTLNQSPHKEQRFRLAQGKGYGRRSQGNQSPEVRTLPGITTIREPSRDCFGAPLSIQCLSTNKAKERRELTRSYEETSPVRGKQDTNPSLHIVFVNLYPLDQSKRQDWDYEGIEIGVGWKRLELVSRIGTTSAWNVQTKDG